MKPMKYYKERFCRSIPIIGLIYSIYKRPERLELEAQEDKLYKDLMNILESEAAFGNDSYKKEKTIILAEIIAHISAIILALIILISNLIPLKALFPISWILTFLFDWLFGKIFGFIYDKIGYNDEL